ncbi:hypothetical protein BYT27DRAFT_7242682 [Phlegmacium glaucopus]|nr:hypothetical protein BYT27DRAFT_7242682 [Phlegmacium glaucopus]
MTIDILQSLPVEILYELHLFALSPSFPMVSSYFFDVFKNTSPFFKATYIVARVQASGNSDPGTIYSRALRYPICGRTVFETICGLLKDYESSPLSPVQLPRRLFRSLLPASGREWSDEDHPLPFLREIYYAPNLTIINADADDGYALTRAVHAQFAPLVQFLLDKGASPNHNGIAVKIAIRSKNLDMLKMLIERPLPRSGKMKYRDKMSLHSSMMGIAISCGANDIVEYYRRKGVVPDISTLRKLAKT